MRKNPPRKLAAILTADMSGFSRLMAADEPATHDAFKKALRADIRPAVRKHGGRIIKTLGDGFLAIFDSPVNAVNSALSIQAASVRRHSAMPDDQRIHFRIGINFGDIIIDGDDIAGQAVNVASRIEALADKDGIVITASVLEHVKGKVGSRFEDIGDHALKNIPEPVKIYRSVAASAAPGLGIAAPSHAIPVVAVLPFTSIGADTNQQYFSDGIAEDIITELTRFRTISVIARYSSFLYRGGATDVQKIGRDLNAQFIVEGSTRHLGKNLRITVQLIHVGSRRQVWAERYDTSLDKLFEVQDDITHRVVATLVPRIESQELETARRRPTTHMRAYDCYLRGRAEYVAARDGIAIDRARRHFEDAIAIDPDFARAYVQLAKIENTMTSFTAAGAPLEARRQRAWELTRKAASLDDSVPMAHLSPR